MKIVNSTQIIFNEESISGGVCYDYYIPIDNLSTYKFAQDFSEICLYIKSNLLTRPLKILYIKGIPLKIFGPLSLAEIIITLFSMQESNCYLENKCLQTVRDFTLKTLLERYFKYDKSSLKKSRTWLISEVKEKLYHLLQYEKYGSEIENFIIETVKEIENEII